MKATQLERGDKYDQSVVHLLSTLDSESFLVEKKGGSWKVTTGQIVDEPAVIKTTPYKLKVKPEKKKK